MAHGQAGGREFTVGVIAHRTLVGAAEQRAVGPFKIKHQPQGFTHLGLAERRPPGIHEQALALGGDLMGDLRLDHIAAVDRREGVAGGPVLGLMLDINVEFTGLEGFKGHVAVAIELTSTLS